MRWGLVVTLTGILLVGGTGLLFVIQNSSRTTQLSLDLGFKAAQLAEPVSIPALMGVCLGLGVVIGAGPLWFRTWRLSSRVRELEARVALDQAMARDAAGASSGSFGAPKDPGVW